MPRPKKSLSQPESQAHPKPSRKTPPLYVLGIMTGTSLDACDLGLLKFYSPTRFELLAFESMQLSTKLRQETLRVTQGEKHPVDVFLELDWQWAEFYAKSIEKFQAIHRYPLDLIGLHGQTVWHRAGRYSYQMGNPYRVLALTEIPVVAQFRSLDTAMGYQGAPLAPLFHAALLPKSQSAMAIHNLGGISNLTIVQNGKILAAFDTGPANMPMDSFLQFMSSRKKKFDQNGRLASRGEVIPNLLEDFKAHPFFSKKPPKSTGREDFGLTWLQSLLEPYMGYHEEAAILRTLTEGVAWSIAEAYKQWMREHRLKVKPIYFCGGGAYNGFLIDRIQNHLPLWPLETTEALGLLPHQVEAAAFAWLAAMRWQKHRLSLANITGNPNHILVGQVFC